MYSSILCIQCSGDFLQTSRSQGDVKRTVRSAYCMILHAFNFKSITFRLNKSSPRSVPHDVIEASPNSYHLQLLFASYH